MATVSKEEFNSLTSFSLESIIQNGFYLLLRRMEATKIHNNVIKLKDLSFFCHKIKRFQNLACSEEIGKKRLDDLCGQKLDLPPKFDCFLNNY